MVVSASSILAVGTGVARAARLTCIAEFPSLLKRVEWRRDDDAVRVLDATVSDLHHSRFFPEFVRGDIVTPPKAWGLEKWTTRSCRTTIEGIDVSLTVVGRSKHFSSERSEPIHHQLLATLMYGITCIMNTIRSPASTPSEDTREYLLKRNALPIRVVFIASERKRGMSCNRYDCTVVLDGEKEQDRVVLEPKQVNGGICYTNQRLIIVYRLQYMHKVLIHELLHCCDLDLQLRGSSATAIGRSMRDRFMSPPSTLLPFEIYVETLACFWYMFWAKRYRSATGKNNNNNKNSNKAVIRDAKDEEEEEESMVYRWREELANANRVCASIAQRSGRWTEEKVTITVEDHGSESSSSYSSSSSQEQLVPFVHQFSQNTNAFEYYIGKTALWIHIHKMPIIPSAESMEVIELALVKTPQTWLNILSAGKEEEKEGRSRIYSEQLSMTLGEGVATSL